MYIPLVPEVNSQFFWGGYKLRKREKKKKNQGEKVSKPNPKDEAAHKNAYSAASEGVAGQTRGNLNDHTRKEKKRVSWSCRRSKLSGSRKKLAPAENQALLSHKEIGPRE